MIKPLTMTVEFDQGIIGWQTLLSLFGICYTVFGVQTEARRGGWLLLELNDIGMGTLSGACASDGNAEAGAIALGIEQR